LCKAVTKFPEFRLTRNRHSQDAPWALDFLVHKYGIANDDPNLGEEGGNAFSRWLLAEKPQHRAGHPVLTTKAFPVYKIPWRHVWRTGFGLDYLKLFPAGYMAEHGPVNFEEFKLLQLNEWQDDGRDSSFAAYGCDVYAQRLSVYIQRNMEGAGLAEDDWEDNTPIIGQQNIGDLLSRGDSIATALPAELKEQLMAQNAANRDERRSKFDDSELLQPVS
jgi:hypothetical protein